MRLDDFRLNQSSWGFAVIVVHFEGRHCQKSFNTKDLTRTPPSTIGPFPKEPLKWNSSSLNMWSRLEERVALVCASLQNDPVKLYCIKFNYQSNIPLFVLIKREPCSQLEFSTYQVHSILTTMGTAWPGTGETISQCPFSQAPLPLYRRWHVIYIDFQCKFYRRLWLPKTANLQTLSVCKVTAKAVCKIYIESLCK